MLSDKDLGVITDDERTSILASIQKMQRAIEDMPKSVAWKMRDKVGTRVCWYQEVEEVEQ